ncbi:hypothetical protein TNCV_1166521 [Trichonephila clavipes]|uniref:Uncharacterized protein n=1 Tax=Trichonephila clavipes TaxID=2585209 RepID=A0A8X6VSV7_TRICX|nr:hypothetical protein TNCV_1166521 [Trichonephila clavipes]
MLPSNAYDFRIQKICRLEPGSNPIPWDYEAENNKSCWDSHVRTVKSMRLYLPTVPDQLTLYDMDNVQPSIVM